jgi:hypothetical protein
VKRDPRRKKKKQKIVSCNLSNSIQRIWVIIMVAGLDLGHIYLGTSSYIEVIDRELPEKVPN